MIPSDLKELCGLWQAHERADTFPAHQLNATSERICIACLETASRLLHPACGHPMCGPCWQQYALSKVSDGVFRVQCAAPDCGMSVPESLLQSVMTVTDFQKLQALKEDAFVASNCRLCYCPEPTCSKVVRSFAPHGVIMHCNCGTMWCPLCKETPHWPATCEEKREWDRSLLAEPPSSSLIEVKSCPSCKIIIEK